MMLVDDPKEATLSAPTLDSSTSVLCKADREALLNLVEEKSRIAFVIKHGRSLFRKLNGLKENKPTDVGLVAFVPEEAKKTISPEVESCFDWIVYYDDSETHVDNLILTLTSCTAIPLPDFDQFVTELLNFIPKDKLILIHAEEFTMTVLSGIREKHGLKGACLEDIDRLCRKERVVEIAENAGILIAKSVFVDFAALPSKTEILEKVTVKVQTFPMFAKPTRMAGSTGTAKLENMEDLERWVDTTIALEEASTYLVQEYVRGREFSVVIVLLQDGLWKPLVVKWNHKDLSNYEGYFKDGLIMARRLRFDDAKNGMFPGIDDFAQQVINAFKPVHPQVFFLQGFQDLNDPMRYYLNELGYRPPGGDHTNDAFYWTCGIDQFAALLISHMDPHYKAEPDRSWKPRICTSINYYYKKGRLSSHNAFPSQPEIKGKIGFSHWFVKPETEIPNARFMGDTIVQFVLDSENKEEQEEDLDWIFENWKPDVKFEV